MPTLTIAPPPDEAAPYAVHIEAGVLDRLPGVLSAAAPAHRYVIVTDGVVNALLGARVAGVLRDAGLRVNIVPVPAGEAAKTIRTWEEVQEAMLGLGVGRDGCVLALGGGVVGDLAGFAAATYLRGIPVVQVPTTLLAMIDASVGGKTGVDTRAGKNLIGALHQPRAVVADPEVLATLPASELRSGLAEALKHGAIRERAYLEWIVAHAADVLAGDVAILTELIARSVRIKAAFAAADPREAGPRQALNFGHTIGHAIEALTGYALRHGHAVAVGMVAEGALGERIGVSTPGTAAVLRSAVEALGLPARVPAGIAPDDILAAVRADKKARASRPRYILLRTVGEIARAPDGAWTHPADDAAVRTALSIPDR